MTRIQIPDETQQVVRAWHGEAGEAWLSALPETVRRLSTQWGLSLGAPLTDGTVSLVLMAARAGAVPAGERQAVLKVPFLDEENREEADALRHYGGDGAVRLYAHDEESGALLLERLEPGTPLREHPDAAEALRIACALLRRLWRAPAPRHRFRSARAEAAAWAAKLDAACAGGDPRLPLDLLSEAAVLAHELSREAGSFVSTGAAADADADSDSEADDDIDIDADADVDADWLRPSAASPSAHASPPSQSPRSPRQSPSSRRSQPSQYLQQAGPSRRLPESRPAEGGATTRQPPRAPSAPGDVVVNRDAHLGNIIAARREPWLLIDPKPLVGEPAFDAGFLVLDRLAQFDQLAQLDRIDPLNQIDRLDQFDLHDRRGRRDLPGRPDLPDPLDAPRSLTQNGRATQAQARAQAQAIVSAIGAHLDLPPARVRAWALVRAVENALWSLEVGGTPEADVGKARAIAAVRV